MESFLRSVVEAPATQRPQEIEEEDDEDDDALAVASLRRVARHLRGRSREDCADELERLAAIWRGRLWQEPLGAPSFQNDD